MTVERGRPRIPEQVVHTLPNGASIQVNPIDSAILSIVARHSKDDPISTLAIVKELHGDQVASDPLLRSERLQQLNRCIGAIIPKLPRTYFIGYAHLPKGDNTYNHIYLGDRSTAQKHLPQAPSAEAVAAKTEKKMLAWNKFSNPSVQEVSDVYVAKHEELQGDQSETPSYLFLQELTQLVSEKVPKRVQLSALAAYRNTDPKTSEMGKNALLLLNAKTLVTVLEPFVRSLEDEEIAQLTRVAVESVEGGLSMLNPSAPPISQQIHVLAKLGIEKYLLRLDSAPWWLVTMPQYPLIRTTISATLSGKTHRPSREELAGIADELAKGTDIDSDGLFKYLMQRFAHRETRSAIDASLAEKDVAQVYDETQIRVGLEKAVHSLSGKEERVIFARFGFFGEPKTLKEVGEFMGISRERVRQIEAKALRRLRHPKQSRPIRELLTHEPSRVLSTPSWDPERFGRVLRPGEKLPTVVGEESINEFAVENFKFTKDIISLMHDEGIHEIGDLFSAAPDELFSSLDKETAWQVRLYLKRIEGILFDKEDLYLDHVTEAVLYRVRDRAFPGTDARFIDMKTEDFDTATKLSLFSAAWRDLMNYLRKKSFYD